MTKEMKQDGISSKGETSWLLEVPAEHCRPGLEVRVHATAEGLQIGDRVITWPELENAYYRVGE